MKLDLDIDVRHLTRVEGHGNIRVKVGGGELVEASWDVVETPRFFEAMLVGQHYTMAPMLTSRICGICSIAHCLASLEAIEDAFEVAVPPAAQRLRLLAKHGETLQSHTLHLFFLAAPDFFGHPSVIPLIAEAPHVVDVARRLKGLGNRLCDLVAGRTTHPVSLQVGGVTMVPDRSGLLAMRDELARASDDLSAAAAVLASIELPDFSRETEFVALKGNGDYPFIGREMGSSDGVIHHAHEYRQMTNEYMPDKGTSKWSRLSREAFAVGPLARFNLHAAALVPEAAEVAAQLKLAPLCFNPFFANVARLVECVHVIRESIRLIDDLTQPAAFDAIQVSVTPRVARGVGVVEAPRGILYHWYELDPSGRITAADCVIPTSQNHANIQHDLEALVERCVTLDTADADVELLCSMLVRSYDPCISCSVH